jgi:hypothetical protein
MLRRFVMCHLIGVLALVAANAQALTLTFEDVPGGSIQNDFGDMPTYQGFNFSSTLDWIDLVDSSWPYGAHSGDFGILNNRSGVGIITKDFGTDFTFDGLWAKRWATLPDTGGGTLFGTLEGYKDGSQVWSVATGVNGTYQSFGPQVGAIDELRLGFGNVFLVDDISLGGVSLGDVSPEVVPEPTTALLLGIGLVAMSAARTRRGAPTR